jgi:ABC-type phosphate/phosphonate transport system substrate-binding protein
MGGRGGEHVEFGMYPFESVAWAWDALWAAVHERVPWTPPRLTRSGDVHARWDDPECIVTHVCGLPYVAIHRDDLDVVGAFALDIDRATPDARYQSVLLSPHETTLVELISAETHAVANSADSLSGWIGLLNATVGSTGTWPGEVTFTSSHYESVRRLALRQADLACIDAWTLAFITEQEPELVNGLHSVGSGPLIPTPAITARRTLNPERIAEMRAAFQTALADPILDEAKAALHIADFVALTIDDYLPALTLNEPAVPTRH